MKIKNTVLKIFSWLIFAFLSLFAIAEIKDSVVSSLLLILAAVLIMPIAPITNIWNKLFKDNNKIKLIIKSLIVFVLFIAAAIIVPSKPEADNPKTETTSSYLETIINENNNINNDATETQNAAPVIEQNKTVNNNSNLNNKSTTAKVNKTSASNSVSSKFNIKSVPKYSGKPYVAVNNNVPYFTKADYTTKSYEKYSNLDSLGRCGVTMACIGTDLMPTEKRGEIGSVKPTGWHTVKYDCVDGKYLYNRCHLIGFQLSGENANNKNLITGTRYMNVDGMLPFENMVADYVKETKNHVMYRVTPIFEGNNLLATGVLMEAWSVEDNGDGICFNVFCYNAQPDIKINYANGESSYIGEDKTPVTEKKTAAVTKKVTTTKAPKTEKHNNNNAGSSSGTYIINTHTSKFHKPTCASVDTMNEENKEIFIGNRDELINSGYKPCGNCHP